MGHPIFGRKIGTDSKFSKDLLKKQWPIV